MRHSGLGPFPDRGAVVRQPPHNKRPHRRAGTSRAEPSPVAPAGTPRPHRTPRARPRPVLLRSPSRCPATPPRCRRRPLQAVSDAGDGTAPRGCEEGPLAPRRPGRPLTGTGGSVRAQRVTTAPEPGGRCRTAPPAAPEGGATRTPPPPGRGKGAGGEAAMGGRAS